LIQSVTNSVEIPVVVHGGAGSLTNFKLVISDARASGVAVGYFLPFMENAKQYC